MDSIFNVAPSPSSVERTHSPSDQVDADFPVLIALPGHRENPAVNVFVTFLGRAFDRQIFLFGEIDSRLWRRHSLFSFGGVDYLIGRGWTKAPARAKVGQTLVCPTLALRKSRFDLRVATSPLLPFG